MALEIVTARTFCTELEAMAALDGVTHWEALNTLVKDKDIDADRVPKLLTKEILNKIKGEVSTLRLIK
jgi:hypothetical protein